MTSLDDLAAQIAPDPARIEETILSALDAPEALIGQVSGHLIGAGGKRLRPMLTAAAARLCGSMDDRHIPLAVCIEFLHSASLLHDDVVDESDRRRGHDSAHRIFGNKAAILVGDFLLSRAFRLLVEYGDREAVSVVAEATATIATGEVRQLAAMGDLTIFEADYLAVARAKTAALFAAATEIGAISAGADTATRAALRAYGDNLGIAFQLADDALDYDASAEALGKAPGDDFRDGKITLPVLLSYAKGNDAERDFWHRTMTEGDIRGGDFETAIKISGRHDALAATRKRAMQYANAARDALAPLMDRPLAKLLDDLAKSIVTRDR
ncbi:MAG: polyprenyl synthetase family protein [Pseudomonadota bacterium]|nr:polyprenyl synthetase family protein [Pseudomonadota bacterium]